MRRSILLVQFYGIALGLCRQDVARSLRRIRPTTCLLNCSARTGLGDWLMLELLVDLWGHSKGAGGVGW